MTSRCVDHVLCNPVDGAMRKQTEGELHPDHVTSAAGKEVACSW
jgi:hypothetical protein